VTISKLSANSQILQFTSARAKPSVFSQSLSGDGSQQCHLLPFSFSYLLAIIAQVTHFTSQPRLDPRLVVCYQSIPRHHAARDSNQRFLQMNPCCHSPHITSSPRKAGLSLLLYQVYVLHMHHVITKSSLYAMSVQTFQCRSCLYYLTHARTAA
jgi:hypothetical protein